MRRLADREIIKRDASIFGLTLLLAMILSVSPAAHSQTADTTDWICEFCPFENDLRAEFSIGVSNVGEDTADLGRTSGYSEQSVYADIDSSGASTTESHQLRWSATNLGLDSRAAELVGGTPGRHDYEISYRQLPQRRFLTTDSIFIQSGASTLSLPAGWVRAPLTSDFTELNTGLVARNIESERHVLELGGNYRPTSRFKFSANYRRHEKDGVKIFGGPYFTQSSLLPGPVDYSTDEVDVGIRYTGERGFLSLGWYLSDFDNNSDSLTWETPFQSAAGAEFAALAQPPDNRFHQVSLSGRFQFSQRRTVVAFTGASGRMNQDALFLPYTTNANLNIDPLPRSSLNSDVDTTNLSFSLTSRLLDKARIKLALRMDKRDNRTARDVWTRVIADSFVSGEAEMNVPYSFERSALDFSAHYDLFESIRVSGGYSRKTIDRDFQEVAEQTEDSGWGRLTWSPIRSLDIDLRGGASERDIERYNETFAAILGQNPLLRKYNLAYRYRRFGDLEFAYSPPDSPIAITLNALYADDDYARSQIGITAGKDFRLAADLSWTWSEKASLYVTAGYENIESQQSGSESFAFPDWRATNKDKFYTAGGGFRVNQIKDKYDLRFDFNHSEGTSKIDVTSANEGLSQFPNLKSKLDYLRFQFSHKRSKRLELTASARYQRFSTKDWALNGVGPATIPVILTLGAAPYDDDVIIVGIGFRYLIGGPRTTPAE